MKDEERNLIENLFHRLKETELNSSERDNSADDLIQKLTKKQPASSYYMAQTILIQETAIKKMSLKIEELKQKINNLKKEESNKTSFLSSFLKKKPMSQTVSHDNNIWKNKESSIQSNNTGSSISPPAQTFPTVNNRSSSSGFLSNALQTATGVAGGMILGNMLMNLFNHSKPEEEIFDNINKSSTDHNNIEDHINTSDNDLVNYEYNQSDFNSIETVSDNTNNETYDVDETDFNDENLI